MNLRKLAVLGATVAALGLPAAALAVPPVDCTGTSRTVTEGGSATRVGVCVEGLGFIEAGIGTGANTGQLYVVASSDSLGYIGVSSFESNPGDTQPCGPATPEGSEGGSGTNAGGCYGTNSFTVDLTALSGTVPLPVCGDETGAWYNTSRNGCRADNEDVDQAVAQALAALACIQGGGAPVDCILANYP